MEKQIKILYVDDERLNLELNSKENESSINEVLC